MRRRSDGAGVPSQRSHPADKGARVDRAATRRRRERLPRFRAARRESVGTARGEVEPLTGMGAGGWGRKERGDMFI